MLNKLFISSILSISTLVVEGNSLVVKPATAVELPDGKKAFDSSLHLARATANFSERNNSAAKYQFTIEVPEDAGETLKSIKITQKENSDIVIFKADKTQASLGSNLRGANIPLATVGGGESPSREKQPLSLILP